MLYDWLEDLFGADGADVVQRLLLAALILLLTWLLRRLIGGIVPQVVHRLTSWTRTSWDDRIIKALILPVRFLVQVWGIGIAILALDGPDRLNSIIYTLLNTLTALGLFWVFFRLVDPVVDIGLTLSRRGMPEEAATAILQDKLDRVVGQVMKALVVVIGFAIIMGTWGYDVNGLIAGLGIGGLAVALAAQDALANLFGYLVIVADEPFRVGEYVVFNGIAGTVEHIGFRSTRVRVLDQSLVSVPNSTVANASITNWSRLVKRRLNMTVGIEYRSSPDQVLSVVQAVRDMLQHHEQVEEDSVIVQFVEFNASSLDLMVICFLKVPGWGDFQAVKQDINLKIMHIIDERGVSIAFPSRSLYIEQVKRPDAAEMRAMIPPAQPEPTVGTASDSPVPDDAAN